MSVISGWLQVLIFRLRRVLLSLYSVFLFVFSFIVSCVFFITYLVVRFFVCMILFVVPMISFFRSFVLSIILLLDSLLVFLFFFRQVPLENWFSYGGERSGRFEGMKNKDGSEKTECGIHSK